MNRRIDGTNRHHELLPGNGNGIIEIPLPAVFNSSTVGVDKLIFLNALNLLCVSNSLAKADDEPSKETAKTAVENSELFISSPLRVKT